MQVVSVLSAPLASRSSATRAPASRARAAARPVIAAGSSSFAGVKVVARRSGSLSAQSRRRDTTVRAAVAEAGSETFTYQAEVNRLMDLIVNSLYSNKEVFLRELVSNASDALDKIRFLSVSNPDALKASSELVIRIKADKDKKQLIIEDSGVGMTRTDLVESLGTIARSGTAKFMEAMKDAGGDASLIGRFGVGFYSAFLVSDKILVESKNNDDGKVWAWESSLGSSQYQIRESEAKIARGTRITLHLKEDAEELLDHNKISSLVKTYSEFISFPIEVWASSQEEKQVEDAAATATALADWEKDKAKAEAEGKEFTDPKPAPVMKSEFETVWGWKVQNNSKPIWMRSPKEVDPKDYQEFFKTTFKEFIDPVAHSHFSIEGDIEFRAILFVPGMAPFDQQELMKKSRSIKLYVRRVFISDQFDDDLMPRYLNFIKGVVDSNDLPLNVSREILQESKIVRVMRKRLIRKSLDMLKDLQGKEQEYQVFWESFGRQIKLGLIEDQGNRDELAALCRFSSSKSGDGLTTLDKYVEGMKEGQKSIFYIAADNKAAAEKAPFIEGIVKKGYEVLYLTDAIDEVAITNLGKYKDKDLVDVTKEGVDLGESEEEKKAKEETRKDFEKLCTFIKETLSSQVESVTVSTRITDSPCALATSKYGWSANMERIMKSQTMADSRAMEYMKGRKIMEINPDNNIIAHLKEQVDKGQTGEETKQMVRLLFDTSLLTSGFAVESPAEFASRVFEMMGSKVPEGGKQAKGSSSSTTASGATKVEGEVVSDSNDPW